MNGKQGGDPAKLARALVQLASGVDPPLPWVAGADAVVDRIAFDPRERCHGTMSDAAHTC